MNIFALANNRICTCRDVDLRRNILDNRQISAAQCHVRRIINHRNFFRLEVFDYVFIGSIARDWRIARVVNVRVIARKTDNHFTRLNFKFSLVDSVSAAL